MKVNGNAIRKRRRDMEMTQEQLSAEVGCSTATLIAWEQGRTSPSVEDLGKLGAALGVSGTDFIDTATV